MSEPGAVTIRTSRLRLRPFTTDDAAALHAAVWGDPRVVTYLPGGKPRTLEQTRNIVEHFTTIWEKSWQAAWAVEEPRTGLLIGECGMSVMPHAEDGVEVFYALAQNCWGKGYATEIARACLRYGFETYNLEYMRAVAVPANRASRRVMEKLGMTYEGLYTYSDKFDEKLAYYSITRDAFDPGQHPYRVIKSE